jgi:hypothetical protein
MKYTHFTINRIPHVPDREWQYLWASVIDQAVRDAAKPISAESHLASHDKIKQDARKFLDAEDGRLQKVCTYAGLDIGWVRRVVSWALAHPERIAFSPCEIGRPRRSA